MGSFFSSEEAHLEAINTFNLLPGGTLVREVVSSQYEFFRGEYALLEKLRLFERTHEGRHGGHISFVECVFQ